MKNLIRNNLGLFAAYAVAFAVALSIIFVYPKEQVHLYFNAMVGHPLADQFFFFITYLGDGTIAIFMLLLIMLYNVRLGLYATAAFLTAAMVSNGLKYFMFDDVNRPFFYFQYYTHIHLRTVQGVDLHIHNSFPSGHATQAFAILMPLAFCTRVQWQKYSWLLLALLTCFSRIYLSQHWLNDVTAGSLVGMLTAMAYYPVFSGNRLVRLNRPINSVFSSRSKE